MSITSSSCAEQTLRNIAETLDGQGNATVAKWVRSLVAFVPELSSDAVTYGFRTASRCPYTSEARRTLCCVVADCAEMLELSWQGGVPPTEQSVELWQAWIAASSDWRQLDESALRCELAWIRLDMEKSHIVPLKAYVFDGEIGDDVRRAVYAWGESVGAKPYPSLVSALRDWELAQILVVKAEVAQ